MRKFIIKIFCFSLPVVAIGLCMEILLRNIPNDYHYKKEYLDSNANKIETLILGSSHTFYGIDPAYFPGNTFNASHISQSLNYDYEIFKKYQNSLGNLKTLIIPLSYFTLWSKLEEGQESWRVKNYVIYYDLKVPGSIIDNTELLSNEFRLNIVRLYRYYILNQSGISCSGFGWGTAYKSEESGNLEETGITAAQRHTINNINSDENSRIFDENIAILNSFAKLCKERNIEVVFVTLPAYNTYVKNLNEVQMDKTVEAATDIADKNNCRYFNLLEDSRFVSGDFYDADHLNDLGAKKLSILLSKELSL